MDLSIVIVSYQKRLLLQTCLESIAILDTTLTYEIWVVDNASADGTVEWLKAYAAGRPWIRPIYNSQNVGFAAANNLALSQSRGEFILLLNSDAYLVDTSVSEAIAFLRRRADAFGCGGLLLNPDGSRGVSYGHFPGPATLTHEILHRKFNALRAVVPEAHERPHLIDFPCGAFFLVRRALLESIGLMDERFFLYFEETDWALRAWKAGHRIYYLPNCRAVHIGGGSSENGNPLPIIATFYESWFLYVRKHFGLWGVLWLAFLLPTFFLSQAVWNLIRGHGARGWISIKHLYGTIWGGLGNPSRKLAKRRKRLPLFPPGRA